MSGFDNDDAMTWGVYPSFHRRWLSFVSGKASLPHYLECPEGCQKGNLLNCLILGTKRKVHDERRRTRSMYRSSRTLPEELLGANHSTRAGSPRTSRKQWQNNWRAIFVIATVGSVVVFLYVLAWPAQVVHFSVVTVGECTSVSEDPNRKAPNYHIPFDMPSFWANIEDFDTIFQTLWHQKTFIMKYPFSADNLQAKLIQGSGVTFSMQYTPGRHNKPKGFQGVTREMDRQNQELNVTIPFDPAKFSFHKIDQREIIFDLIPLDPSAERRTKSPRKPLLNCVSPQEGDTEDLLKQHRNASVIVNIYPYAVGCIAVAIQPDRNLPQTITEDTLRIGFFLASQSASLRLGYNSIHAGASVNHLHLQGLYVTTTRDHSLPVERVATTPIITDDQLHISELTENEYPLRALVFSLVGTDEASFNRYVSATGRCLQYLLHRNLPHNFIITNRGKRLILYPRHFQVRVGFGDAYLGYPELSGLIVITQQDLWEKTYTHEGLWETISQVSMTKEEFTEIKRYCCVTQQ